MNAPVGNARTRFELRLWQHPDQIEGRRVPVDNLILSSLVSARHPSRDEVGHISDNPDYYLGVWKGLGGDGVAPVFVFTQAWYSVCLKGEFCIRHVHYLSYSDFYERWTVGMTSAEKNTCGKNFYVVVFR